MHRLTRCVRFSVNPFLSVQSEGDNSYASKPAGEGLAIFLELYVEVTGRIDEATGFIINVADIDKSVRLHGLPVLTERITEDFRKNRHVSFFTLAELLGIAWKQLSRRFGEVNLSRLTLKLNPSRTMAIETEDFKMVYLSEKFEFAAMHKLWNDGFSEKKNLDTFGKCANPTGHGHNYVIEVTIKVPKNMEGFSIADFEKIVSDKLISRIDHKNLNLDIEHFGRVNPTVENITSFAWNRLLGNFNTAQLHSITVWENDKTFCSYYG
ncbi:6-pyruvoyl tetrahydropterin synthase family protein [Planctomycetota bacterium]